MSSEMNDETNSDRPRSTQHDGMAALAAAVLALALIAYVVSHIV